MRLTGLYGWLGVPVFFVISGFVIPYAMYNAGYSLSHFGRFLAKRLIRLDPPYLASILLILLVGILPTFVPGFAGQRPSFPTAQVLAHLGYLNTFLGYQWLNPVYWSLAIEFQYYLLIGFL